MAAIDVRTISNVKPHFVEKEARGVNASMPPQWLIYITVEDLDASIERCKSLGGLLIDGPRELGGGRCAVIRDPADAVAALYEPSEMGSR